MVDKETRQPTYTPERTKELVDRMVALRLQWLASVNNRTPKEPNKPPGELSKRLEKIKDWPRALAAADLLNLSIMLAAPDSNWLCRCGT